MTKLTKKSTIKITNSACAIQADVPATPLMPKNPAMIATTRNVNAHWSMVHLVE